MYQNGLRKWLLSAFVLLLGTTAWAGTETITFSSQGWTNAQALATETVNGTYVTVTFGDPSSGTTTKYYNTGAAVRIYGGGSMTVTAKSGYITGIVLNFNGNDYAPTEGGYADSGSVNSGTTGTWSGNATAVTFTRPSGTGHWRVTSIEVTTSAIHVDAPTFSPESGETFTGSSTVTISGPSGSLIYYKKNGTVSTSDYDSYGSSPQIVTVDQTMTISAIAVLSGTSSDVATASYTVTSGGGGTGTIFRRINSSSDIEVGARYIIVAESANGAMGGIFSTNYRTVETDGITLDNGTANVEGSNISVFTLGGDSNGYTFYDGTYYLANSTSSQLNSLTSASDNKAKWTITFSGDEAQIKNVNKSTYMISYYSRYNEFNCYTATNGVYLYKEYIPVTGDPEAPAVTGDFSFWPEMTDAPSAQFTIVPAQYNTVYYTTDGTEPSSTNGTRITSTTNVTISGTTTVKAISYLGDNASEVVTRTYTLGETVTGIGEFKNLASGTTARLYLPDEYNARVLFVKGNEVYVRDNTGSMCIYGLNSNPTMAYNQHLAGWIIGTYVLYNGLPEFTVTSGKSKTWFLAIANPVTEEDVNPVEILASEYASYQADWVTIKDLTVGASSKVTADNTELVIYNKFNLTADHNYQAPYEGAIVDLSGIAVPYDNQWQIAPISQNGVRPLTYVIDSEKDFTSPSSDISPAAVRLNRTLYADRWNTLTLPFAISNFDGTILEYSSVESAGTASAESGRVNLTNFVLNEVTSTEAGKPYLVKPTTTLVNPVFESTTLSAAEAQTVSFAIVTPNNSARRRTAADGTYSLVGVYNPTTVDTGSTISVLDSNSIPQWSSSSNNEVEGTSAYFATPENTVVQLKIGDEIITEIEEVRIDRGIDDENAVIFNILGQRMTRPLRELPQGIYIVNGVKVVK